MSVTMLVLLAVVLPILIVAAGIAAHMIDERRHHRTNGLSR